MLVNVMISCCCNNKFTIGCMPKHKNAVNCYVTGVKTTLHVSCQTFPCFKQAGGMFAMLIRFVLSQVLKL